MRNFDQAPAIRPYNPFNVTKTENDIKRVFGLLGQFAGLFKVKIGEFEVGID